MKRKEKVLKSSPYVAPPQKKKEKKEKESIQFDLTHSQSD